jgi:cell division protein FtsI (penicillin-binding protein 3)
MTIEQGVNNSSNVVVSRAIVKAYGKNPNKFIDKLHQMGIEDSLKLEITGAGAPRVPHPSDRSWSHTSLPWLSIGYEVRLPPIYTLTFYNAIANNGKMIRPYFVKAISSNGSIIKTFETETVRSQICSPKTLEQIRKALLGVVENETFGTAKNVKSKYVRIAGKTGTAQILPEKTRHQVSFCGYFPADNPQYTCIVVLRKPEGSPSGGLMSGAVFKTIAEGVMALKSEITPEQLAADSLFRATNLLKTPYAKNGKYVKLQDVMNGLHLQLLGEGSEWITAHTDSNKISIRPLSVKQNLVPNVVGMGAKDAVYLMESAGLHVNISGYGKVQSQSIAVGTRATKGATVGLVLR